MPCGACGLLFVCLPCRPGPAALPTFKLTEVSIPLPHCSVKKSVAQQPPLPVPTLLEAATDVTVAPKSEGDPYAYRE